MLPTNSMMFVMLENKLVSGTIRTFLSRWKKSSWLENDANFNLELK